ncbi:HepT-like ribonuclease domain-containing protein [Nostoc flagelliforme]
MIHDYFDTDVEVIWKAVQEDVPQLKTMISGVLEDLSS